MKTIQQADGFREERILAEQRAAEAKVVSEAVPTECEACGDDFGGKVHKRQAKGMDICVQCALDNGQPLDPDDENDLAEAYWSGREQAACDGGYYSSERMDAARGIGR